MEYIAAVIIGATVIILICLFVYNALQNRKFNKERNAVNIKLAEIGMMSGPTGPHGPVYPGRGVGVTGSSGSHGGRP